MKKKSGKKILITEAQRQRMMGLAKIPALGNWTPNSSIKKLSEEEQAMLDALLEKKRLCEGQSAAGRHDNYHDGFHHEGNPLMEESEEPDTNSSKETKANTSGEPSSRSGKSTANPKMPKNVANVYKGKDKPGGGMTKTLCEEDELEDVDDEYGEPTDIDTMDAMGGDDLGDELGDEMPMDDMGDEAGGFDMGSEADVQTLLAAIADAVSSVTGVDVSVDATPDEMPMDDMEGAELEAPEDMGDEMPMDDLGEEEPLEEEDVPDAGHRSERKQQLSKWKGTVPPKKGEGTSSEVPDGGHRKERSAQLNRYKDTVKEGEGEDLNEALTRAIYQGVVKEIKNRLKSKKTSK